MLASATWRGAAWRVWTFPDALDEAFDWLNAENLRRLHFWFTVVWACVALPGVLVWQQSIPFLVFVSIYANFVGHFSSWQAARSEAAQYEEAT